jgi:hypothetical protein
MKATATLTISFLCLLPLPAQVPDAIVIMDKSRELSLTGSVSATVKLEITEKNGSTRSRTISMSTKSYSDGQERRLIKFLDPADVKGTAMLIFDNKDVQDEMWIYLPALKKTRRIVSSEKGKSFMSSEFSNADMSSPALPDFDYKHLNGSGTSGQWIIESTPVSEAKADEYGFSKKVSYVSTDNYQVIKMEFYNFDNELYKTVEIKAVHSLPGNKYLVSDMVAMNQLNGRKSEIVMENIVEGTKVDDSLFTVQNLVR